MTTQRSTPSVSRRTTLAALAALADGGLGMALVTGSQPAPAEPVDYSDHPLGGVWLAMANPPVHR